MLLGLHVTAVKPRYSSSTRSSIRHRMDEEKIRMHAKNKGIQLDQDGRTCGWIVAMRQTEFHFGTLWKFENKI